MDLPEFEKKIAELKEHVGTDKMVIEFTLPGVGLVIPEDIKVLSFNDSGEKSHVVLVCLTKPEQRRFI